MLMIDAELLREPLAAYHNAQALHECALEQLGWLGDRGAQDHHWGPALAMRDQTYEALTLAALALATLTAAAKG
jgi:hypothetical protein